MQVFSKCGVIKPGDDNKPRVKVYRDKALGNVAKGDGLVIYLKAPSVSSSPSIWLLSCSEAWRNGTTKSQLPHSQEHRVPAGHVSMRVLGTTAHASVECAGGAEPMGAALWQVDLACRILDGAQLRPGQGAAMTVQPAKFEMHGGQYQPQKKKAGAAKRQKKANAQAEEKLLGWGGFDDQQKPTEVWQRTGLSDAARHCLLWRQSAWRLRVHRLFQCNGETPPVRRGQCAKQNPGLKTKHYMKLFCLVVPPEGRARDLPSS